MNYLCCSHCGRSIWITHPLSVDELVHAGRPPLCLCGHANDWLWRKYKSSSADLPELRATLRELRRRKNLTAAASHAASEVPDGPEPTVPAPLGVCGSVQTEHAS